MSLGKAIEDIFLAKGSDLGPGLVMARALIVFVAAIVILRIAKKRSIAQASAMDLVFAIILGSLLSRSINGGATLISGLAAGFVLVVLERIAAHFAVVSDRFATLVKGHCQVLIKDGVVDREMMRKHDISEVDLHSEMRLNANVDEVEKVKLAVLERSGRIGVVRNEPA